MYGKMFRQMYHGTLATTGPWQALVTFQQLIVLADQDGVVDMTPEAISRETTIPLDIIKSGLEALEQPDPDSRTPDAEGRRITLLSDHRRWGWQITNYKHYRALKREDDRREYQRQYWHKRKDKLNTTQQLNTNQPIAEAEAEAEALNTVPTELVETSGLDVYRVPNCPFEKLANAYHEALPMLPRMMVWSATRQKHVRARWAQVCAQDKMDQAKGMDWFGWFFRRIASSEFLTGQESSRDRAWRADFDWIFQPGNFAKIIEGRYHR